MIRIVTLKGDYRFARGSKTSRALSGLLLAFVLAIAAGAAQKQAPTTAGKASTQSTQRRAGSIKGRVLDESGRPFANAVVYISPLNGVYEETREMVTDENGNFQADGLLARPYVVECYAKGYVGEDSNAYHLIGESITLWLRKGGVITGTVTNLLNEPVVKAKVLAIRVRDCEGRSLSSPQNWDDVETDDRGIYRIYGLESGSYLLMVNQIGKYDDKALRNESSIYYPSATRYGAQEVTVNPGQEVIGINITYRGEPGHVISGKCSGNLKPASEAYMKLIQADSGVVQEREWKGYKENGSFAFYGVPDGDYYVIAQNDYDEPSAASQPYRVVVKGRDVTGIELKLAPFGSIAGRVVKEAPPKPGLNPECKPAREFLIGETVVRALRHKAAAKDMTALLFGSAVSSAPDEKNDFLIQNLPPGQYLLKMDLFGEDFYVAAATRRAPDGKTIDAAQNPLTIKSGERITDITITVREGAASIRGSIAGLSDKAKPPAPLSVYLVPSERENADLAVRYAETKTQSDNSFAFTNVAPGRYLLLVRPAAVDETDGAFSFAASTAAGRAALRREAEAFNKQIDLQPCERVTGYSISYAHTPAATKPGY